MKNIFVILIFAIFSLFPHKIYSKEKKVDFIKKENSILETNDYRYILGIGDLLSISLIKVNGFDNNLEILPDGTINLPRLGSLYIAGLTISEATEVITQSYKKILKTPIVFLNLLKARPIKIVVIGEVQRPGIYSLTQSGSSSISNSDGGETLGLSYSGWPRVVDGLQKAGGVTSDANLRKVYLTRSNGSNKKNKKIILNFWEIFNDDRSKFLNPLLYDGDTIKVEKAKSVKNYEILKVSKSNLAPSTITINVVGEVVNPGIKNVRSGAPLSEGIFAAGGLSSKAKRKNISLYRLNDNGSISLKKYEYKVSGKLNEFTNPSVKDRDVIIVGKRAWSKFNSGLKSAVEPLTPLVTAGSIYRLLSN